MKKFVKKVFLTINLIIALLLLVSGLSVHISPEKAWFFAFFGLMFPYILLLNLIFIIFWLVFKRIYILVSLAVIILCWSSISKFVQVNIGSNRKPEMHDNVKLLSFNVRLFNYYNWLKIKSAHHDILNFIKDENAGIICLQEILTMKNTSLAEDSVKKQLSATPYSHIYYSAGTRDNRGFGMATFSKYPIIGKGVVHFTGSSNTAIFSDIKVNGNILRIYNCHLQSTQLGKSDYNFIDSLIFGYDNNRMDEIMNISRRLKNAYIKRAKQVDQLNAHILRSPYPVVLCGDFNDTPVSYTYHVLKQNMRDAYLESGSGIGNTYFGNFPYFRIDYIIHSKSLDSFGFKTKKVKLSDHLPLVCGFSFDKKILH
ncbi:MAG: endonuclease/exonuclease/phosphatase family protein [Bacteroidales bacterium]|nr:endonuclease/exonuclease/phosphatase family protein [Bacteroidales bacterium]